MAQRILRPLSYGDIFDELFDLYKKNFLVFAGISAVVYLPIYVLSYALAGKSADIIAGLLVLPAQYVAMAATTWAVSQTYLGGSVTIGEAYKAVWRRSFALFATLLVAGVWVELGFMACVVPGVILLFRYAFISQVFVLEGQSGKDARVRSTFLADGNVNRIFVIYLVSTILTFIIIGVLTFPFEMGMSSTLGAGGLLYGIAQGIAMTLTAPISILAFVLLYYDVRVRKEGFDIQMLAANMGQGAPTPVGSVPDAGFKDGITRDDNNPQQWNP